MRILCYGDSNTWGVDPETKERLPPHVRWTGVLQQRLGSSYVVIEEGLCGRTTVWDDPIEGYKNGKDYLIPCLASHRPLDLVVIMLGTNDLKKRFSLSAYDIASGAGVLAGIVQKSDAGPKGGPPQVLLIAPFALGKIEGSEYAETFGKEGVLTSRRLAHHYRRVADELGCAFLDAGQVVKASPIDAIHLDAEGHQRLGTAVADRVQAMWGS